MARLAHPNVVTVLRRRHAAGRSRVHRDGARRRRARCARGCSGSARPWREVVAVLRAGRRAGSPRRTRPGSSTATSSPTTCWSATDGRVRVTDFGLARRDRDRRAPAARRRRARRSRRREPAVGAPDRHRRGGRHAGVHGARAVRGQPAPTRAPISSRSASRSTRRCTARGRSTDATMRSRAGVAGRAEAAGRRRRSRRWLERVVLRAVALDPDERFPTMDALLAALAADPIAGPAPDRARRRRSASRARARRRCVRGARRRRRERAVRGAARSLTGVWDATTRAALADRVSRDQAAVRRRRRGRRRETLDAYAAGWVAMRTEACEATRVRGHQTEAVLDAAHGVPRRPARRAEDAGRVVRQGGRAARARRGDLGAEAQPARRVRRRPRAARARSAAARSGAAASGHRAAGPARRGARAQERVAARGRAGDYYAPSPARWRASRTCRPRPSSTCWPGSCCGHCTDRPRVSPTCSRPRGRPRPARPTRPRWRRGSR